MHRLAFAALTFVLVQGCASTTSRGNFTHPTPKAMSAKSTDFAAPSAGADGPYQHADPQGTSGRL